MTYKILQLTDLHLFKSAEGELLGVHTNARFMQVLDFIQKNAISFDCIFLTGDISQDETPESYTIVADALSRFSKKVYWIAGNHDDIPGMRVVFEKYPLFHRVDHCFFETIGWNFIFVDTVLQGRASGYISIAALEKLADNLLSTPESALIAIVMHHHPFTVDTPLVDKYILENADDFFAVIAKSRRHVDLIMCGHVHENYDIEKYNTRLISSPATCLQWKKGTHELAIRDIGGFNAWTFAEGGKFNYATHFVLP